MGRLDNKVALITGAGGGIGRETAILFAKEGCKVLAVDVNDTAGNETIELAREFSTDVAYTHADVSQSADCESMIQAAEEQFGALHILFNNAGIMHPDDGNAMQTTEEIWDLTMDINLKGVYLGCKYGIPAIKRSGGGSVINTASFVALMGAATPQLAYTASKGGVIAMSRELAIIHAKENIRCNALCPGPLHTKMLMDFLNTDEKKQRRLVHIPMGRFGLASEMAQAALYLASDESSYVNGTEFVVDGGITSAYVTPE
ncbi:MAG: glucose 1-dehydrogenase [Pirellulaceae bacterium]